MLSSVTRKAKVFWPLLLVVLLADCTTKSAAEQVLMPPGEPHSVVGETVRFTLVYNTRGAMGLPVGSNGRAVLGWLGILVSGGFFLWYRRSRPDHTLAAAAAALLIAGALGNAWQRVLSSQGVVDFIDIGWGAHRFWTFNVADVAISVAACLLFLTVAQDRDSTESAGPAG